MQGQRGTFGSMPETLNFDHGSSSSNAALEQQLCWNNIRNPVESRLADCLMSPNEAHITYSSSYSREPQTMSRWSLGEASSSGAQDEVNLNDQKTGNGWSSSMSACGGSGSRIEERYEQNSPFVQRNSNSFPQNLNLNAVMGHSDDDCQAIEHFNLNKSSGSRNEQVPPSTSSESFLLPSGSSGYSMEDNDGRPGSSFEGRRASCKRKALEANVGQSSMSGGSSYLHCAEGSPWSAVPAYSSAGSLSISTPSEHVNPRLGLSVRGSPAGSVPDQTPMSSAGSSRRNFRMRINPSSQRESLAPALFRTNDASSRNVVVSSSHPHSRHPPVDHSLDLRSTPVVDNASPQNPNVGGVHVPILPPNVQPFSWNGSSAPRTSSSINPNVSGDREAVVREEQRSRSLARNLVDHPLFMAPPEFRSLTRTPSNRGSSGGNLSVPGNVSRTASTPGANQTAAPSWASHPSSSLNYPRRYSELVRRSLLTSLGPESGEPSSNHSSLPAGPPASPEVVFSAGIANPVHHRSFPRSASWLERQGDTVLGVPQSLRSLAAASEGRSRLYVSEIRNVLNMMRRGEGLRFEDVMILDHSGFLGVAEHDRHRDMRLDVDNMSYEELLALEERIGNVNTGLTEETILKRLKQRKLSITPGAEPETEPCCVCQEEYKDEEDLGTLECGHDFHSDCIKQWLMQKNLCPICKTTGLST